MHQSPSMSFLIHESAEEYHAKAKHYLSSHQLADFRKCPQLYYRKKTQPRTQEESPAYLVGRAAHVLILEGLERFREDFAVGGPINPRTGQPFGAMTKAWGEWAATVGNPVEYHILRTHPGDGFYSARSDYDRIPADAVLHWFRADRPGQTRGIRSGAPEVSHGRLHRWPDAGCWLALPRERDIADGCDFYGDIDPNLATYFHDSISADIDSLLLHAGVHAKVDGWHYTFASRFPFVIWYGVINDNVVVYVVLDGRRNPDRNAQTISQRRLKNE